MEGAVRLASVREMELLEPERVKAHLQFQIAPPVHRTRQIVVVTANSAMALFLAAALVLDTHVHICPLCGAPYENHNEDGSCNGATNVVDGRLNTGNLDYTGENVPYAGEDA